jgi:hypothetical protein
MMLETPPERQRRRTDARDHSSARWHATVIAPIVRGAGVSTVHRSIARGQRVRKAQPLIAISGDAGSATATSRRARRARVKLGVLASSVCVYG